MRNFAEESLKCRNQRRQCDQHVIIVGGGGDQSGTAVGYDVKAQNKKTKKGLLTSFKKGFIPLTMVLLFLVLLICKFNFESCNTENCSTIGTKIAKAIPGHQPMHNKTTSSTTNKQDIAIFINTYLHPKILDHGSNIIEEIIDRINAQPKLAHANVYYSRFGQLDVPWPQERCQGGNEEGRVCHEIKSSVEGSEEDTLQALYEYCNVPDNEQNRVIYMHSKGSYRPSDKNEVLRKLLLAGVLSDECIDMPKDSCSACSTQFTAFPVFHYVGNMWVSDCAYIRKLISPKDFTQAKDRLLQTLRSHTTPSEFIDRKTVHTTNITYPDGSGILSYEFPGSQFNSVFSYAAWMGIGRYAMEHYLYSHPDARPCDVFGVQHHLVTHYKYEYVDIMNALLQNIQGGIVKPMLNNVQDFVHEGGENATYLINAADCHVNPAHPWYKKEGRMYQYMFLYPESGGPPNDSWLYDFWHNLSKPKGRPCTISSHWEIGVAASAEGDFEEIAESEEEEAKTETDNSETITSNTVDVEMNNDMNNNVAVEMEGGRDTKDNNEDNDAVENIKEDTEVDGTD